MKIVIDSSTLISLAAINAIDLIKKVDADIICPEEIYQETVEVGSVRGHPDAVIIKGFFDDGTVKKQAVRRKAQMAGMSKVDSLVISLGKEANASYLFINDTKLARRGTIEGFDVRGSPDILLRLHEKGTISKEEYTSCLQKLFEYRRISKENMERYLKEGEE
jgi:predicted nucleic acid-binding protein